MADSKPQITATIKFRGVTIEGMTVQELKELRDVLNSLVGDKKEYVPYPQPYPVYPVTPWYSTTRQWIVTCGNTTTTGKISLGTGDQVAESSYTISCN